MVYEGDVKLGGPLCCPGIPVSLRSPSFLSLEPHITEISYSGGYFSNSSEFSFPFHIEKSGSTGA